MSSKTQKRSKKTIIVPAWKIQIVDDAGNPMKDVFVRQVWQDYDIENTSHEEDTRSDANGYVIFPERNEKTVSNLTRTKKKLKNLRELGVHASFGVDAYVLAWGKIIGCQRLEGDAHYVDGKPLPARLQMRVVKLPGFKCDP
jgi:hypothetical protein